MSLLERIQADVTTAMKAREKELVTTLRLAVSELKKQAIDTRAALSEAEEVVVLQRLVKQRKEAAEAYRGAGRVELAAAEESEAEVLSAYLPAQLTDEELDAAVREEVARAGATSPRDMGRVMGPLMARFAGRLDGNRARQAVQAALAERGSD